MIKNIIFDLGGVIVGLNDAACIAALDSIKACQTADYVRTHRTEDLFLDIELGRISTEEFCREVRKKDHIEAVDSSIIDAWNLLLSDFPIETINKVALLSRRYRVFLLSNTNDMHWQYFLRRTKGLNRMDALSLFEHCFLSYEMGMKKPSHEIFLSVLKQAGLNPAETLFIDDNADNCQSASELGIRTLLARQGMSWIKDVQEKLDENPDRLGEIQEKPYEK